MSNWWADKLSSTSDGERSSAPVAPLTTPRYGISALQQPTQHQQVQQQAQQSPAENPNAQINMATAIRTKWEGGPAERMEGNTHCPECDSHLVFSRANASENGHAPRPRCWSCGWNGKYVQADKTVWAS